MRVRIIYALVAALLVAAWVSRAGNATDAQVRSRCAAIGVELLRRAADKRPEVERFRSRSPAVAKQWDDFLGRSDVMGKTLTDNFTGPEPMRPADRAWAASLELGALAHEGEGCTGGQ